MLYLIVGLVLSVVAFLAFQVADDARINGISTGIQVLLYFLLGCVCALLGWCILDMRVL